MNNYRALIRMLALVTAAVTGHALVAQPAVATTGENIVVFGDSFTASPDDRTQAAFTSARSSETVGSSTSLSSQYVGDYPQREDCLQNPHNWPRQMAAATGEDVVDWSCTGKTSKSVLPRIDAAIEVGDIRPSTKAIYLAIGGNDFGLYGLGEGNNPADPAAMRAQYSAHLATTGEKIRAVAPGAKIIVTGLPQASNGTTLCVLSVIRNAPVGIPFPGEAVEPAIRDMQRAGAEANGMEFVDNYAMTAGHDTCAPEEQRYVSGLIDTTTPGVTMLLHPTVAGHKVLARNNYAAL